MMTAKSSPWPKRSTWTKTRPEPVNLAGPAVTEMSDHNAPSPGRITLSVDAMGGDSGAATVVAGLARYAADDPNVFFLLHGPEDVLAPLVSRQRGLSGRVEIVHAQDVVTMEDKPSHVMRHGKGTSMWSTLQAVRENRATVAVSCGNTGALMALSVLILRRLPGVIRPAIAVYWPSRNPQGFNVMLDVGADVRADAQDLLQYAMMGGSYARNGLGLKRPRIGLLNVGTEEHKGRAELKEAHELIGKYSKLADFDFMGFVEGSDIPGTKTDVIVTDGFTGNVALKTGEGTARMVGDLLREAFRFSIWSRLASLLALTSLKRLRKRIDPRRVNGGVFLGLNGTVVKSHGGADATGVAAAVGLAVRLAQSGFSEKLAARVASSAVLTQDEERANGVENNTDAPAGKTEEGQAQS